MTRSHVFRTLLVGKITYRPNPAEVHADAPAGSLCREGERTNAFDLDRDRLFERERLRLFDRTSFPFGRPRDAPRSLLPRRIGTTTAPDAPSALLPSEPPPLPPPATADMSSAMIVLGLRIHQLPLRRRPPSCGGASATGGFGSGPCIGARCHHDPRRRRKGSASTLSGGELESAPVSAIFAARSFAARSRVFLRCEAGCAAAQETKGEAGGSRVKGEKTHPFTCDCDSSPFVVELAGNSYPLLSRSSNRSGRLRERGSSPPLPSPLPPLCLSILPQHGGCPRPGGAGQEAKG